MRRILILIIAIVGMTFISGLAHSKAKGTISGRVTDPSGNGIANVSVDVYDIDDIWTAGSSTDENGNYTLRAPAGNYRIHFCPLSSTAYCAPEWYDNKGYFAVADLVPVTAFRITPNIDAQLEAGGKISGRVTNGSGSGIPNVYVDAFNPDYNWIGGSSTDGSGNYIFNVPVGTYEVRFGPLPSTGYYAPEWYDNKTHFVVADLILVAAYQTTSAINAQLGMGATISGQVTGPFKKGIANVYVGAFDSNEDWTSGSFGGSSTDGDGRFSFNVPAGSYRIRFSPLRSSGYFVQAWYNKREYFELADLVLGTLLQTTSGINAQLEIGGAISGRVTNASGNGIASVGINAYDLNGNFIIATETNSNGLFTLVLAAGDYKVEFVPSLHSGDYLPKWYNIKDSFRSADTITVNKRRTKSKINIQLEPM